MQFRWPLKHQDFSGAAARRKAFRDLMCETFEVTDVSAHELVFGELVTNAVRYGTEPISVAIAVHERQLQIQVENAGPCFDLERSLRQPPSNWGGRGLKIVRKLVNSLTVESLPHLRCRVTATMAV